jgi:aminopeptidase N
MNTYFLRRFPSLAFIVVFAFAGIAAQKDFNRPQVYDVQHYTIRVSFDRVKQQVFGDTSVRIRSIKNDLRSVELDSVGIVYNSVEIVDESKAPVYRLSKDSITVDLNRPMQNGEEFELRFKYTAIPKKGVYFVPADRRDGGVGRSAQIWTQGEPDEARHWFPSFDFPSDKATTEKVITVETGETVIGNGELISKKDNSNRTTTWHYKMPVPHSTYLVSFVIGQYVKIEEKYDEIPLGYYVYPGREASVKNAYSNTREMMGIFEDLTGVKYPFNKYDQTMVARFQFGGMENITATTMADTEIFFADMDFARGLVEDLVSHELAHSWFGNLVTCRNWAELWLNEGFATFMEAAYRERKYGRGDYMRKIRTDAGQFLVGDSVNRKRHGLFNERADKINELFDNAAVTYNKGSAVIHMLREEIGDNVFWRAVNTYLERHKFDNVETTDLKRVMEEVSGRNLAWFFDQWVYGGGAPRLDVRPLYNARTKTLTLRIDQTQVADGLTPPVFRLPMDLRLDLHSGSQTEKIIVDKRSNSYTFKVAARPKEVILDESEKIPLKNLRMRPILATK